MSSRSTQHIVTEKKLFCTILRLYNVKINQNSGKLKVQELSPPEA